jgi:hypothetical protein
VNRGRMLPIALALMVGTWLGSAAADTGAATPVATAEQEFVGSWQLLTRSPGTPPSPALLTFFADGTLLGSGLPVQPEQPDIVFISTGHGAWNATGIGTANATLVLLVVDTHGNFLGTETDQLRLQLDPDGQTCQGEFRAIVSDPNGQVENTLNGTVQGTRIVVEPTAMPPGTPPA